MLTQSLAMSQAPEATQIDNDTVRVFVGADASQAIAFKTLEFSIRRRTGRAVDIRSLAGVRLPAPSDRRNSPRTEFSFARFAIPELAGRTGRAIYLDADMLVLADIGALWDMPLGNAKVLCQEELPDRVAATAPVPGTRRRKQCSVMVLDCGRLSWNAPDIVAGLGSRYSYDALMSELCILDEEEVSYKIPLRWNSLEFLDGDTALIHYTDMMTQPWVFAANRNGWKWTAELRAMRAAGAIGNDAIWLEIERGFVRPSLLYELDECDDAPLGSILEARLMDIDREAGFKPHRALAERLADQSPRRVAEAAKRYVMRLLSRMN